LRSTTKAFSKIAQKYTVIGLKKKAPLADGEMLKSTLSPIGLKKEDSSATNNIILQQSEMIAQEEEVKKSTKLTHVKHKSV
jgi:hypothetical protein